MAASRRTAPPSWCFTDYARPAMRLAALMGTGVIYVMTHDSIGLGEDGPTHQPVEHLAALRAIPNMRVFRPCDADGDRRMLAAGAEPDRRPTVLALTRQNLPQLRTVDAAGQSLRQGAYELAAAQGEAKVSLFASGSEVEIAIGAAEAAGRARHRGPRRLGALLECAGAAGGPAAGHHRRRAGQGRHRGRRALGLGRRDRLGRRCSSACTASAPAPRPRTLPAFRHHRRGGG